MYFRYVFSCMYSARLAGGSAELISLFMCCGSGGGGGVGSNFAASLYIIPANHSYLRTPHILDIHSYNFVFF